MLGKAIRRAFAPSPAIRPGLFLSLMLFLLTGHASPIHATDAAVANAVEATPAIETKSAPLLLELIDSALIAKVWRAIYPDSALPSGEFQIVLPYGPEMIPDGQDPVGNAFLLRNGTEVGRLERAAWQQIALASKKEGGEGWSTSNDGANREEVPILWKAIHWNLDNLFALSDWPAGLLVGIGSSISSIPFSKPQYERDIDFAWSQKLRKHYLLGLELHRSQFGGGLTRMALEADAIGGGATGLPFTGKAGSIPFWGEAYWWWAASVGVPGLKYTLALANQPLPQYYWLDPSATAAVKERRSGQMVNQWTGSSLEQEGNLSHTLDARLGYLRYGFHFDSDAYNFPVQTIGMDDLPSFFGSWGGGLILASDIIATRVWLDIPDLALSLPRPLDFPTDFRLAFLRLEFAYRNIRNFNLGVSVRIHLDNPIMNRPGA